MRKIEEILQINPPASEARLKPKEKITLLAEEIKKDKKIVDEIIKYFGSASVSDQGHLIESLEYTSQNNPEAVIPYLNFVIKCLEDKAPRVKWEAARVIANLSGKFSQQTQKVIPNLLKNPKDKEIVPLECRSCFE